MKKQTPLLLFLVFYPVAAYGEGLDPLSSMGIARTLLSLVVVCALAVLVLKLIAPKLQRSVVAKKEDGRELRIVERLRLDARCELLLIQVGANSCYLAKLAHGEFEILREIPATAKAESVSTLSVVKKERETAVT